MPIVAIIGAVIGDALIGTSLGMIGAVSVGSVIGAGVASGIYADMNGGSFFNGFITGAATAGIGGLVGAAFGPAAQGTTAASMAADQTAGFSYGDLADWGGTTAADWGGAASAANLGNGGMDNLGFGPTGALGGEISGSGLVDTYGMPSTGLGDIQGTPLAPNASSTGTMDSMFNDSGINNPYADLSTNAQTSSIDTPVDSYQSYPSNTSTVNTQPATLEGMTTGASQPSSNVTSLSGVGGDTNLYSISPPAASNPVSTPVDTSTVSGRIQNGLSNMWDKVKANPYQAMQGVSGLMDMYSQQQLANQYASDASAYQKALNNPQIGFDQWMAGAGGQQLRQNAAQMAKSGRTGAGPAMATQAMQNWYTTGQPAYMNSLKNLYDMKGKEKAARYSSLTTPFQSFAQMFAPSYGVRS